MDGPLYSVCRPVQLEDIDELGLLPMIGTMMQIVDGSRFVGLAANQAPFGVELRIIVINCEGWKNVILNPVIEKTWGGMKAAEEGCRSFPGKKVRVVRPRRIRFSGITSNWEPMYYHAGNYLARTILHEVDHLNGITMFMRAKDLRLSYDSQWEEEDEQVNKMD